MNRPALYSLSALFLALLALPGQTAARPLDFNEVSLLVRCRESESSIRDEVTRRKLMRPLTTQQEATLKAQGASQSLVQSLRERLTTRPRSSGRTTNNLWAFERMFMFWVRDFPPMPVRRSPKAWTLLCNRGKLW